MGLAPSRRLLYSGTDAPLWFVSAPSELCTNEKQRQQDNVNSSAVKGCGLASTEPSLPPPSFAQLRLVPLIKRYFPSSDSVLFRQLMESRKHQHPRYHFLCKQFLPPTAYIDPTAHYYDLELKESEKDSMGNEVYEAVLPATKAPFSSADVMYELLVENTEKMLFENEEELKEAMRANMIENSNNASGGKSNNAKRRRIRPVPCAVLILRCHGPAVNVWDNNIASFGLANAAEALSLSPRGRDATIVVEDERSWLAWELGGVKISGSIGGFYGCWTLDELLHCEHNKKITEKSESKTISYFPYSSTRPFGLVESSLIVSGCVERDVGEREQPHAWVSACRAFANTMIESVSGLQLNPNEQQIPLNPFSMLQQLDLSFIPLLSNIPQIQLCRQVHLFVDILEELAPEIPTLVKLQMLLRERNNKPASGDSRTVIPQRDSNKVCTLDTANGTGNNHSVCGVQGYGGDGKSMAAEESNKGNDVSSQALPPPSLIALREKGICSYIADGAVVLRLSNDKVVEALQKLSCISLSDSTESIVMALTSRVPPPLQYRGVLRPPNAYAMCKEKLSGVVRRAEPHLSESLLLSWSQLQSQDVFSVGRDFDGVPFSFLIAPELPPASTGGEGGVGERGERGGDGSHSGTQCPVPPKSQRYLACSGPLKVPNVSVAFGDLIRCDIVNGCWYVDRQLHAEDVALSWMRRVAGKARESRDSDEHWLRFPQQECKIKEEGSESNDTSSNMKGIIVRLGRFRPWHVQHDGYSYFHCITVRGTGAPPANAANAVTAAVGTTVGQSTNSGAETVVNNGTLRAAGKKKGNTVTITPPPPPLLQPQPPITTTAAARTTIATGGAATTTTTTTRKSTFALRADMMGNRYPSYGAPMEEYMDGSSLALRNCYPMGHRLSCTPPNPPNLPLFVNRMAPFPNPHPVPYAAGVGPEPREEPSLTVSRLLDGWGAFDMERVPSAYSSSANTSPTAHSSSRRLQSLPSPSAASPSRGAASPPSTRPPHPPTPTPRTSHGGRRVPSPSPQPRR